MVSPTGRPRRPRLRDLTLSPITAATDGSDLVRVTLQGDFSGLRSPDITVEEAHILRASFVGAQLAGARLADVLVEGADLSGADLGEASLSRVAFIDCRMSGVQLDRTRLHDVSFAECKLDGANLRMSEADRIVFDHVNLRDAEFSAGRLASACFFDCDLGGADFSQALMPDARLHGSSLADIKGSEYLRDIVIDSTQVLPLALRVFAGLGIRMEDERDAPGSASEANG